mmetsp:Transcript_7897/g.28013  ORF Transcript_7897/g.28013 Transcript_7897/m.28013 type:complete len:265 (-) Transcript_7897:739-1533(-)
MMCWCTERCGASMITWFSRLSILAFRLVLRTSSTTQRSASSDVMPSLVASMPMSILRWMRQYVSKTRRRASFRNSATYSSSPWNDERKKSDMMTCWHSRSFACAASKSNLMSSDRTNSVAGSVYVYRSWSMTRTTSRSTTARASPRFLFVIAVNVMYRSSHGQFVWIALMCFSLRKNLSISSRACSRLTAWPYWKKTKSAQCSIQLRCCSSSSSGESPDASSSVCSATSDSSATCGRSWLRMSAARRPQSASRQRGSERSTRRW